MTWSNRGWGQFGTIADDDLDQASPVIVSFTPTSGSHNGGTSVAITGVAFQAGAKVLFGTTQSLVVTVNSQISITATAPAHIAGTVIISVINPNSKLGMSIGLYTYT